ncbi:MAG: hydroxyacid dehydrogenase [Roseitalea sp.]|jgi:D-3-phosphoglycerate dehydrogenase|nr:hydroxyacid dehydrogenase [Roseitalea sp.]MBO6720660.1 hydroxyacid dehydrogenase [Roseitalea sp.]MBO6743807.1 hydroxyacid dehydrogenase [Roseitalea sp.]
MAHILVAGQIHGAGIDILDAEPGVTFDYVEEVSERSYAPLIGGADALVLRTQPLSAGILSAAARLKVVSRHGVGHDAVDLEALNERGVALMVVGDLNATSVAEHAMMMILACAKRALMADSAVRKGDWSWRNDLQAVELAGKNLLIIGYGRAGRRLAAMASAFGMQVGAYDPVVAAGKWPAGPAVPIYDLVEALGWADMISLHVPRTDRPLIGAAEIRAMKSTAILVNTARGGVVDETALADALVSGRLAGAGVDVFEKEPPLVDQELFRCGQLLVSPHIAGLTAECAERMAAASVRNALDYLAGKADPDLIVNRPDLHG